MGTTLGRKPCSGLKLRYINLSIDRPDCASKWVASFILSLHRGCYNTITIIIHQLFQAQHNNSWPILSLFSFLPIWKGLLHPPSLSRMNTPPSSTHMCPPPPSRICTLPLSCPHPHFCFAWPLSLSPNMAAAPGNSPFGRSCCGRSPLRPARSLASQPPLPFVALSPPCLCSHRLCHSLTHSPDPSSRLCNVPT